MLLHVISAGLLLAVAIVSLAMAFKGLFASRVLPFHEKASGVKWEAIDPGLQMVERIHHRCPCGWNGPDVDVVCTLMPVMLAPAEEFGCDGALECRSHAGVRWGRRD
jgi:hypothetical protein